MLSLDISKKCLVGEGWSPVFSTSQIQDALQRATFDSNSKVGSVFQVVSTKEYPPTYFRTNKVTSAFQEIVDAYGNHWTLTVANPEAEIVYYMDPLKRRIANEEWVDVVDNAIKMYKDGLNRVTKKKILWENMAGVPLQTGSKDCGMFVMRNMKEIIEDKELQFAAKWMRRLNLVYTVDDINEIRIDITNYFMKRHAY